jgi:large subunit ribosomal protein L25
VSQDVKISAELRTNFGKGAARSYRRQGRVPAVMYGSGSELRHITLPGHDLDLALRGSRVVLDVDMAGTRVLVAPADVQRDAVRGDLLHVDLMLLSDADVRERHAYSDALARAEAAAEEAGLDPVQVSAVFEEAAANDEDLADVADRIVEILQQKARAMADAGAAAAAAEEAAEAAEAAGEGEESAAG